MFTCVACLFWCVLGISLKACRCLTTPECIVCVKCYLLAYTRCHHEFYIVCTYTNVLSNNAFVWNLSDGHIHAMSAPVPDETNLMGFMHRVVDFEESDRETMHLLVFLLMQFLSRSDQVTYNYVHPCLSVTKTKKKTGNV